MSAWDGMTSAIVAGLLLGIAAAAPDEQRPSPLAGASDNPALVRFGRSIVFYVSFDGHPYAEITAADPRPTGNAQWQAASQDPHRLYAPGLFGQSLRSGDHQLSFACPKPVLGTSGAMALWLKPEQLHHRGTYCWPAILRGLDGRYGVLFGRIGDPANGEALYAHLAHGQTGVSATQQTMAGWQPGGWHLLVVNWDRHGVEFSVDGAEPSRVSLKAPLEQGSGGLHVCLPGQNEDRFLYDEFLVLDVSLTPAEIRWIYEDGMKRAQP